jgi:hypothetical protein
MKWLSGWMTRYCNPVPAWGNTGQIQGGCQTNLEVGDPLSGNEAPRIFMSNGFTYHLQELAFFSWFFGSINGGRSSIGVHRWFSDNATFLTDAGPVCIPPQHSKGINRQS